MNETCIEIKANYKVIIVPPELLEILEWNEKDNEFILTVVTKEGDGETIMITPTRVLEIKSDDIIVNAVSLSEAEVKKLPF